MSARVRPAGWLLDNSVASRLDGGSIASQLERILEPIGRCPISRLEELYSATSGQDYDANCEQISRSFVEIDAPADIFEQALVLQRDLAHHHGLWHRIPIPDLLIAVTALANNYGVLHNDKDYERIAKVRPLITKKIG